jgi:putative transposase
MSTPFYDTDLTDAAWAWVAPVLPAARPGGRPRTTNLRAVLNAIFYLMGVSPTKVRKVPQDFCQQSGRKGFSAIPELPRRDLF